MEVPTGYTMMCIHQQQQRRVYALNIAICQVGFYIHLIYYLHNNLIS